MCVSTCVLSDHSASRPSVLARLAWQGRNPDGQETRSGSLWELEELGRRCALLSVPSFSLTGPGPGICEISLPSPSVAWGPCRGSVRM